MKNFKNFFKNTSENGGIEILKNISSIIVIFDEDDEDEDFDFDFGSLLC